jgi:hypothetical protein
MISLAAFSAFGDMTLATFCCCVRMGFLEGSLPYMLPRLPPSRSPPPPPPPQWGVDAQAQLLLKLAGSKLPGKYFGIIWIRWVKVWSAEPDTTVVVPEWVGTTLVPGPKVPWMGKRKFAPL